MMTLQLLLLPFVLLTSAPTSVESHACMRQRPSPAISEASTAGPVLTMPRSMPDLTCAVSIDWACWR